MLNPSESSKYEDQEAIIRISHIDTQLTDEFASFQNEQLQNFYLAQGYILSAADLNKLITERRPHFQSNLFNPKVLKLAGNFIENMPGIDVFGVEEGDHQKAVIFKSLNDHINNVTNSLEYELAKAYMLAIIARITWVNQYYSYEAGDHKGNVCIEAYTPFLKFDTSLTDMRTLKDCNYIDDDAWYSPEEILHTYARKNPELTGKVLEVSEALLGNSTSKKQLIATWSERIMNMVVEYGGEIKGYDQVSQIVDKYGLWINARGKFKVIDFYERRDVPVMIWHDWKRRKEVDYSDVVRVKDFGRDWYDNDKLQLLRQNLGDGINGKFEEDTDSIIYQTSIAPGMNLKLYDAPQQLQNGNFKFSMLSCYDFHPNALETKSVIDHIKDPVRSYNLRDNTNLTYLMRVAHGGMMAEESAVKGKETALRKSQSTIGGMDIFNNGALSGNKIKEKSVPTVNQGVERYQEMKLAEVDLISGIGLNAVGRQESANESGKLFNSRVQESDVMQAWVIRNANNLGLQISKNNLWFIQNFMKEERSFRILQDFSDPYWLTINKRVMGELINDVSIGQFDVQVSKTIVGRIGKEIKNAKTMQLTELMMKINPQYVDVIEVIKASDVDNMSAWIKRVELVEGKIEEQLKQQTAIEEQQTATVEEENLLNFAKEYAALESQLQQNKAFVDESNYDNVLQQAMG